MYLKNLFIQIKMRIQQILQRNETLKHKQKQITAERKTLKKFSIIGAFRNTGFLC